MRSLASFFALSTTALCLISGSPAMAQYASDADEMAPSVSVPAATASNLGVRMTQLEERLRMMQGTIEETNFRNRKLEEKLIKIQQENDFRFKDLEAKLAAASAAPSESAVTTVTPPAAPHDGKDAVDANAIEAASKPDAATKKPVNEPAIDATKADAPKEDVKKVDPKTNPAEQYNHAFRLLNQTKYDESRAAFKEFIAKNPKSPLISNAYYWMGETYYVKRDYVQSADAFRQGYESNNKGTKAADNLLKLSMSLSALKRKEEACIVLKQVVSEYEKKNATATNKARTELTRLECAE